MSKNVTFSLNTGYEGGKTVIEVMAETAVMHAAENIANRADRISQSIRQGPQKFEITESGVGLPNRKGGTRFYAKVQGVNATFNDEQYSHDYQTLRLALDAGRVTRLV